MKENKKAKICDKLLMIFGIIGVLSVVAVVVTTIIDTYDEWDIIYKIYGILVCIAIVGFITVSVIMPIPGFDNETDIPSDTNYTYTHSRKHSSTSYSQNRHSSQQEDDSYSLSMVDKVILYWAFDKMMNKMTGRDKKNDYSFGNDTWNKKYPDAFDNDFGPDYEDNGFNKFDDNDGY